MTMIWLDVKKCITVITIVWVLSACSTTNIPVDISQPLADETGVAKVREQPNAYQNKRVRWGGLIVNTRNTASDSRIAIVSQPLNKSGRPVASDHSEGRFIAVLNEFVEPLVYSRNRQITISGHVTGTQTINVGEYQYEYPLVEVDHYYLWPKKPVQLKVEYPPYWRDPWLYPDYYPWPYYYRVNPNYKLVK